MKKILSILLAVSVVSGILAQTMVSAEAQTQEEAWSFEDSFTGEGYKTYATSDNPVVSSKSEIKTVAEYNNGYKWITSKKLCGVDWEADKLGNAYLDPAGSMVINTMWGYGTGIYLDTGKTAVEKLKTVKFQTNGDLAAVRLAVSEDEGSCFEFGKASRSSQRFFRGITASNGTAYVSAIREKAGERQWYKSDFADYADDYLPEDGPWESNEIVDWEITFNYSGRTPKLTWRAVSESKTWTETISDADGILEKCKYPIGFVTAGDNRAKAVLKNLKIDWELAAPEVWSFEDDFAADNYKTYAASGSPAVHENNSVNTVAELKNGYKWVTSGKVTGVTWETAKNTNSWIDSALNVKSYYGHASAVYLDAAAADVKRVDRVKFVTTGSETAAVRLGISENENSFWEFGKSSTDGNRIFRNKGGSSGDSHLENMGSPYVTCVKALGDKTTYYKIAQDGTKYAENATDYTPGEAWKITSQPVYWDISIDYSGADPCISWTVTSDGKEWTGIAYDTDGILAKGANKYPIGFVAVADNGTVMKLSDFQVNWTVSEPEKEFIEQTDNGDGTVLVTVNPSVIGIADSFTVYAAYFSGTGKLINIQVKTVSEIADGIKFDVTRDTSAGSCGKLFIWKGRPGNLTPITDTPIDIID